MTFDGEPIKAALLAATLERKRYTPTDLVKLLPGVARMDLIQFAANWSGVLDLVFVDSERADVPWTVVREAEDNPELASKIFVELEVTDEGLQLLADYPFRFQRKFTRF